MLSMGKPMMRVMAIICDEDGNVVEYSAKKELCEA